MVKVVIADPHGCYKTLKKLFSKLPKDSEVYIAGDVTDKGPNTSGVIDFCVDNDFKLIRGNHDHMCIKYFHDFLNNIKIKDTKWYKHFGGIQTMKSYKNDKRKIHQHLKILKKTPIYLETIAENQNYFITHGFGLPYYDIKDDFEKSHRPIMSNRVFSPYYNIRKVQELEKYNTINVFGHDSFPEIFKHELFYGIDTGCVHGKTEDSKGVMTALILDTGEVIQTPLIDDVDFKE